MRIAKSAAIAWATAVSVAAVIGLGGPVWAESKTNRPATQSQQPGKAGQPKGSAIEIDGVPAGWVKGDAKPPGAAKAPK